jgi:hypothetical protein
VPDLENGLIWVAVTVSNFDTMDCLDWDFVHFLRVGAPDLSGLRLRGWRATAVCDRRIDGLSHQEISAQLCMSLGMVMPKATGARGEQKAYLIVKK